MIYRVTHRTAYRYPQRVSHCYNMAHVIPRTTLRQRCRSARIELSPEAAFSSQREDYFGNQVYRFEIQNPHEELVITSISEVETSDQGLHATQLENGATCAQALDTLARAQDLETLMAREFCLDSPMLRRQSEWADYARELFLADKPLALAVMEFTHKIFEEFDYTPASTSIATPLSDVMANKQGVCQDFAHLQIACLRSLGFAAKYVSGYLETLPPEGQEKLVGADASHAWVSVYCPGQGWLEFDPTNNCMPSDQHIITAWGRDYFDVTPVCGVIFGGGEEPELSVSVDVSRI